MLLMGVCVTIVFEARILSYRHSQILWAVTYSLFIFLVAEFRPLVVGSLFKLVASLALACLLAFVVVHSANICRLLMACLYSLPASLFPLPVCRRWLEGQHEAVSVPNEPSPSILFQRPPPILA